MKYLLPKFFILFFFVDLFFTDSLIQQLWLHSSKLSPDQRQQLIKQYSSSGGDLTKSAPTAQLPNRSVIVEQPNEESFEGRSDFLGDLNSMERMISADVPPAFSGKRGRFIRRQ